MSTQAHEAPIPRNNTVEVVAPKNGVGQVTGAVGAQRAEETTYLRWRWRQAHLPQAARGLKKNRPSMRAQELASVR